MAKLLKVTATFKPPTFDYSKWKTLSDEKMREQLAKAVFVWIQAATAPIPVWSGASLATFQPLASEISYNLSIRGTRHGDFRGLGPAVGVAESEGSFEESKGVFKAIYATSLRHLIWNEYHNANTDPDPSLFGKLKNPGPYNFQEKGRAAALPIVKDVRMPMPVIKPGKTIRVK